MKIEEIWDAIEKGIDVYTHPQKSYKIYKSKILENNEYQLNHFSHKNGFVLSDRCISNYFGGLITLDDLENAL